MPLVRFLVAVVSFYFAACVGPINDDCEPDETEETQDDDYRQGASLLETIEAPGGYWTHWRRWTVRRRTYPHFLVNQGQILPIRTGSYWTYWHTTDWGFCFLTAAGGG